MAETYRTRQEAVEAARDDLGKLLSRDMMTVLVSTCEACAGPGARPHPHMLEVYEDLTGAPGDVIRLWVHGDLV